MNGCLIAALFSVDVVVVQYFTLFEAQVRCAETNLKRDFHRNSANQCFANVNFCLWCETKEMESFILPGAELLCSVMRWPQSVGLMKVSCKSSQSPLVTAAQVKNIAFSRARINYLMKTSLSSS